MKEATCILSTPHEEVKHTEKELARFWKKVQKTEGCWIFTGGVRSPGYAYSYGSIRFRKKTYAAHRMAFYLEFGPITQGMNICHRCDNMLCVNPSHLFEGTQLDNMRDMIAKGRKVRKKSRFTPDQILEIREGVHSGEHTRRYFAEKYEAPRVTIDAIIRRKIWAHI